MIDNGYMNLSKAAKVLGIQVRTARQWVRDGKLNAIKYPNCNRWFVSKEEIERICGKHGE